MTWHIVYLLALEVVHHHHHFWHVNPHRIRWADPFCTIRGCVFYPR